MARVLVTGATGHLGAHVVRDLLAHGHDVRALARPTSDRRGLDGLDLTVVEGDLLDPPSLGRAADGCAWVIHAAAVHRNSARHPEAEILRPTVEGTTHMVRAAADAGVERFVHVSSNATIGYARDGEPLDESAHNTDQRSSPYIRAKCASEARALELGEALGIDLVVANPCGNLGPWDLRKTPTTRGAIGVADGGPSLVGFAMTHVADIAVGLRRLAEDGTAGERTLLTGDNLTAEGVAEVMNAVTGSGSRAMHPPRWLLWLVGAGLELGARFSGGDPDLTRAIVRDAGGCQLFYDASKARDELGWAPRPAAETARDTVRWLHHMGWLSSATSARLEGLEPDPDWPSA